MVLSQDFVLDEPQPRTIVGVVADIRQWGPGGFARRLVYSSFLQQPSDFLGSSIIQHIRQDLVIRLRPDFREAESTMVREAKTAIAQIDPDLPVTDIMNMNQVLADSLRHPRAYMTMLEIFAGLAVFLAMMGIYSVMSYFVTERTHEIGIRIALGARRSDVLGLVTGVGLRLTALGLLAGAALAAVLTRAIDGLLFGISATDPLTFAAVAAALTATALLACYIPAWRAARVNPNQYESYVPSQIYIARSR